MRNLAKTIVIVAACLVTADVAVATVPLPALPFVQVSLPQAPLEIGTVWGPGPQQVGGQVKAHVVANCGFRVEASFQTFRHLRGKAVMSAKDLTVAINGKQVPVGVGRVAVAESPGPTPSAGVDVPVDLKVTVTGLASYPAGRYGGALVIKVMAAP
jgi:hypothetical protein